MKTRTIIFFFLILLILGLALTGLPQGIVNDGGYISGNASNYLKVSGSGDALLVNSSAGQVTLGNLDIDFSGSGMYKLTLTDTSFITVDGSLSLSDTLLLESDNGVMASLITNGTVSGAYTKVEQNLGSDQWNMVSSPISAAKASVYNGSYLLKWGETDSTWTYLISPTDPLNTSEGYFVWPESSISSPTNVSYSGLLNTGDKTVSGMTYTTGSGKGNGWNLVGNPYPSPLEWNSSWTKSGLDATVYIYDGSNYKTWNYNLGGFGSMGNGYIPSTQGFWVKANSASPSMTIPNSERTHAGQSFYKNSENEPENIFKINVTDGNHSDQLILGMHEGAGDGYSGEFDAYKLFGDNAIPQLFAWSGSDQLAVDIIEHLSNKKKIITLGFRAPNDGNYIMNFENLNMINPKYSIYLEDLFSTSTNQKLINIKKHPVYKFYATAGMNQKRFVIHFQMAKESFSNQPYSNEANKGFSNIYASGKDVFVNYQKDEPGELVIIDMMGKEILKDELQCKQLNRFKVNQRKGYYIVRVLTANSIETQKIFIN